MLLCTVVGPPVHDHHDPKHRCTICQGIASLKKYREDEDHGEDDDDDNNNDDDDDDDNEDDDNDDGDVFGVEDFDDDGFDGQMFLMMMILTLAIL